MKLGFIGGGNMAAALIGGLLQKGFQAADIMVAETSPERREWLAANYPVTVQAEPHELMEEADLVVLAVKPQQLRQILLELSEPYPGQLFLSIAAGVRAADISRWLGGHPAVVRAMPNTPALIGVGMTGLYALSGVSQAQRQQAGQIMQAVGVSVWVEDEALIDAVTAISGSGPAYVFYLIEALEEAAVDLGLAPELARLLSLQTFLGASALAVRDGEPPATLRARVTSKGGTTEQGIRVLEESGVKTAMLNAARAAAERSRELADILGRES
ncbi:MAG TPA: pyrroline-5-carboxylate reductase [Thiobacillaceae bacterium]|nr:pyrroline-5-carboxylate reductase [Thiobacillaceae bacterium]